MHFAELDFRWATLAYLAILCPALGRPNKATVAATFVLSITLSFGLHALLTQFFSVDLP